MDCDEDVSTLFYKLAINSPQRNYWTYERQRPAVVKAFDAIRVFLLGRDFTLRSDHNAFAAIIISALRVSSSVKNWLQSLQPFALAIEVIACKQNVLTDSPSSIPWRLTWQSPDTSDDFVELLDAVSESACEGGIEPSITLLAIHTFRQQQSQETDLAMVQERIATGPPASRDELHEARPTLGKWHNTSLYRET